jgi:hypothetical protein
VGGANEELAELELPTGDDDLEQTITVRAAQAWAAAACGRSCSRLPRWPGRLPASAAPGRPPTPAPLTLPPAAIPAGRCGGGRARHHRGRGPRHLAGGRRGGGRDGRGRWAPGAWPRLAWPGLADCCSAEVRLQARAHAHACCMPCLALALCGHAPPPPPPSDPPSGVNNALAERDAEDDMVVDHFDARKLNKVAGARRGAAEGPGLPGVPACWACTAQRKRTAPRSAQPEPSCLGAAPAPLAARTPPCTPFPLRPPSPPSCLPPPPDPTSPHPRHGHRAGRAQGGGAAGWPAHAWGHADAGGGRRRGGQPGGVPGAGAARPGDAGGRHGSRRRGGRLRQAGLGELPYCSRCLSLLLLLRAPPLPLGPHLPRLLRAQPTATAPLPPPPLPSGAPHHSCTAPLHRRRASKPVHRWTPSACFSRPRRWAWR